VADRDRCHACGDPVQWVTTHAGTRLVVDVQPSERGTIALVDGVAVIALRSKPPGAPLFLHHYVTCRYREAHV
jgi:hypothetical protein